MKLLYKKPVIFVIGGVILLIILYYSLGKYREGAATSPLETSDVSPSPSPSSSSSSGILGFLNSLSSPGLAASPGQDSPLISDEFCAAINNLSTKDQSDLSKALNELANPDNPTFTDNQKQILMGIKGNQTIYQGQFLDIQKKLCAVYSRIKIINKKLPKDAKGIQVGTVGTCSFEQAQQGAASISIDISGNPADMNYGIWKINAILPIGPPGDQGEKGPDGLPGAKGDAGFQGERGIRGDWAKKPNPVPENTQNKGYLPVRTNVGSSIY